ncbi:MAG: glycosyltransferase family 87 protein [Candidatus Obscuribacterales bacterium]
MPRSKLKTSILLVAGCLLFLFSQTMVLFEVLRPLASPRWYVTEKQEPRVTDFFQYYQASALARSDKSSRVYDPEVQRQWVNDLIAPLEMDKVFYNQQPPSSYTLLYPLSFAPPNIAYVLWCLLQVALGLSGLYLLLGLGPLSGGDHSRRNQAIFLALAMSTFPAYSCLWHGNTTFFLLAFLSGYIYCFEKGRDILAGAFLALATFKPQYLFAMMLPAVARGRLKIMAGFAATELVLLGLAVPIIGIDNVLGYPNIVGHAESSAGFIGVNAEHMISIRGLLAQFVDTGASLKITAFMMFAALVPLFFLWSRKSDSEARDYRLWGVTVSLAVLFSPHSHTFDFLLLAMPAALTLAALLPGEADSRGGAWTAICLVFLLFAPLSWLANFGLGYERSGVLFFLPAVAMLAVLYLIAPEDGKTRKVS